MLRQYGAPVGIDLTWTGLAFARSRGERAIAQATAAACRFPTRVFDVVTSFDVIYALDDADGGGGALANVSGPSAGRVTWC